MEDRIPRIKRHLPPARQGLYDPANEHDACGLGFIAHIKGQKSHAIVTQGLQILKNLTHRGATGADPLQGDGAGILIQLPDAFLRRACGRQGLTLPAIGQYGVGMVFLPQGAGVAHGVRAGDRARDRRAKARSCSAGATCRPTTRACRERTKEVEPVIRQVFIARGSQRHGPGRARAQALHHPQEVRATRSRRCKLRHGKEFYVPSMSTRTIVYKGMLLAHQVGEYYLDLQRRDDGLGAGDGAPALLDQHVPDLGPRASVPPRLPQRRDQHAARQRQLDPRARSTAIASTVLGEDLDKIWPLIYDGQSDSASFDNALELLRDGRLSARARDDADDPEAWAGNPLMDEDRRAFYEYHAALMEPWDGPAAMAFTDGRQIGATLDRNGLRPARYIVTDDDYVIMASEVGVLDIPERKIVKKWRLQPGKMLLVDTEQGRIIDDDELKRTLATAKPYREWIDRSRIALDALPEPAPPQRSEVPLLDRQQAFGYTQEDLKVILAPMAQNGEEAIGSMGNDAALPVLSNRPKVLYSYFKQLFAQVTNPPIDPIREELVMSLVTFIGPRPNLLGDRRRPTRRCASRRSSRSSPPTTWRRSATSRCSPAARSRPYELDICYPAAWGADGMEAALASLCAARRGRDPPRLQHPDRLRPQRLGRADADPGAARDRRRAPAPGAQGAAHQHRASSSRPDRRARCTTSRCSRATAPRRSIRTSRSKRSPQLARRSCPTSRPQESAKRFIKAICKGLYKVMSKMGISTYQSYCGAQIFEAVGLQRAFVDKYFTGTREQRRGHRPVRGRRGGRAAARSSRSATIRCCATRSMPAASTSTASAARSTCGRRTRSPSCSTRRAPNSYRDVQGIRGADQRPERSG